MAVPDGKGEQRINQLVEEFLKSKTKRIQELEQENADLKNKLSGLVNKFEGLDERLDQAEADRDQEKRRNQGLR